jgi:hypothetical protein
LWTFIGGDDRIEAAPLADADAFSSQSLVEEVTATQPVVSLLLLPALVVVDLEGTGLE